jgi:hypothetical protein
MYIYTYVQKLTWNMKNAAYNDRYTEWNSNVETLLLLVVVVVVVDYPPSPERLEWRILGVSNVEWIGGRGVDVVVVKGLAGAGLFVMMIAGERRQEAIGGRGGTTGGH